jgi:hypothetical protein
MAENAIAIPIKVATIPVAGFTVFTSAVRLRPFLPLAGSACFAASGTQARTARFKFLGK